MRRIRSFLDSCMPCRYDYAIAAAILVAFIASQMLSTEMMRIEWFFNPFEIQVSFEFNSIESAFGIAVSLAFMTTLNAWLIFGSSPLKRRIVACLLLYALAATGVFCGGLTEDLDRTARATPRSAAEFASELYVGVLIHAVCVVGLVSLAAIVFQLVSKRRLSFDDQSSGQHTVSISDLFLATSLAAVTLTLLRQNQTVGNGFTTLDFVIYGALISVAGVVPPVLIAFSRFVLPTVTSVWFALLGSAVALVFDEKQSANHLSQVAAIHAFTGFLFGIALTILRRHGLRFASADSTDQRTVVGRRWNPRFAASLVITLAIMGALTYSNLHMRTLLTAPWGTKYSSARTVVHMASVIGWRPDPSGFWQEPNEDDVYRSYVRFSPKLGAFSLRDWPQSVELCRVGLAALRHWKQIHLHLDHFSREHARSFHGAAIDELSIVCKRLEVGALAVLCDEARIRELQLRCPSLSVRDANALAEQRFRKLSIGGIRIDNPEVIAALSKSRFDYIDMEVMNSDLLDLSEIRCRGLSFENSRIGRRFLERLPNDPRISVSFRDCTFEPDVTDEVFQDLRAKFGKISSYGPKR